MRLSARLLLFVVAAFLAALGGVFVGRHLFNPPAPRGSQLHEVLHHQLHLDAGQQTQLAALEQHFTVQRRALELELKANNVRLAEAIEAEHGQGPRVIAAVDRIHGSMGELQKATLAHVFAMRQILRPEQQPAFDRAVVTALTDESR